MIARLRGEIVEVGLGNVVLDVHGVGYLVMVPDSTATRLPSAGETAELHIHTHVREDAIVLYGFLTKSEQRLFQTVVGVAGVGPKLALSILSHVTPERFAEAVALGDEKRLTKVPGIGKKTAARILLELKDKLKVADGAERADLQQGAAVDDVGPVADDAVDALMALGYSEHEAKAAVSEARRSSGGQAEPVEQVIRAALRLLDRVG